MPITDSRTTLEARHNSKLHDIISCSNIKKEVTRMNWLKNELVNATDWEKKCALDAQIESCERIIGYEHNSIDYMLSVVPIIQRYTDEVEDADDQHEVIGIFVHKKGNHDKGKMYDEFMNVTENVPLSNEVQCTYTCTKCNIPRIMSFAEATMICPQCGDAEMNFEMGAQNMSYDQEINSDVNICFAYKRINHFNEWMAQFQAKESTYIPQDILNSLRYEFKKARVTNMADITQKRVKELLKKLKYNKFYEHVPQITNMLSGVTPPTMSPQLEETLRNMFRDIQEPFEKHKPKGRSNFLSYGYCLYKFCELLGHDEFLDSFPLLKSREKLYQQDCIFKNICKELQWEFLPTI
jgi:cell fate (sporulation/competence/biofilm development) regulator YmcA (YheA/YmcA/DUF963 family)